MTDRLERRKMVDTVDVEKRRVLGFVIAIGGATTFLSTAICTGQMLCSALCSEPFTLCSHFPLLYFLSLILTVRSVLSGLGGE